MVGYRCYDCVMTSHLTPTPIVDKNGKQTTVLRSNAPTTAGRSLPKPTTPGANKALSVVRKSLNKAGLPRNEDNVYEVARHLSATTGAGSRYQSTAKLIARLYSLSGSEAKQATDSVFNAVGLNAEIKETTNREVLMSAATKKLNENFKVRYPKNPAAGILDAIEAVREDIQSENPTTIEIDLDALADETDNDSSEANDAAEAAAFVDAIRDGQGGMIDKMNAMLATDDKATLAVINEVIGKRTPKEEVEFSYLLMRTLGSDLSEDGKREAVALVADDYIKFDEQQVFIDDLFERLV
jgi:hypothetical protein